MQRKQSEKKQHPGTTKRNFLSAIHKKLGKSVFDVLQKPIFQVFCVYSFCAYIQIFFSMHKS